MAFGNRRTISAAAASPPGVPDCLPSKPARAPTDSMSCARESWAAIRGKLIGSSERAGVTARSTQDTMTGSRISEGRVFSQQHIAVTAQGKVIVGGFSREPAAQAFLSQNHDLAGALQQRLHFLFFTRLDDLNARLNNAAVPSGIEEETRFRPCIGDERIVGVQI